MEALQQALLKVQVGLQQLSQLRHPQILVKALQLYLLKVQVGLHHLSLVPLLLLHLPQILAQILVQAHQHGPAQLHHSCPRLGFPYLTQVSWMEIR